MTSATTINPSRVAELTAREEASFREKRKRSHEILVRARRTIPRGVPSTFQDAAPQPLFIDRGEGSHIWDVDGNEYVDFHNGFGVMIVGHAHPKIVQAVTRQIERGSHYGQPIADTAVVAEELQRRFHQPLWRFGNSGTEATLDSVHLSRGFTGRSRLVKIEASYHGHHDALLVSVEPPLDKAGPPESPNSVPYCAGILDSVSQLTSVVPFNDIGALERCFATHKDEIAAVILEPAMMNIGIVLPDDGYLQSVVDIAHKNGALVVFDEVKTGVTIAAGGATERFGVLPDIVCLAKAIGGGLPCGAIGGRADVMEKITSGTVAQFGTFNGNPLTTEAMRTTLCDILTPAAYVQLEARTTQLKAGLDAAITEHLLPFYVVGIGARGCVVYRAEPVRNYRDYASIDKSLTYLSWLYQSNRGVLMAPGAEENWTISVQHSTDDIQRYIDNFAIFARDIAA